jgi:ABC-type lipoprotein release transport system permease subunit
LQAAGCNAAARIDCSARRASHVDPMEALRED